MKIDKIYVCQDDNGKHFLRVHFDAGLAGVLRFESERNYTKCEADYRAVVLSSSYGFARDELPTHPKVQPYPDNKNE